MKTLFLLMTMAVSLAACTTYETKPVPSSTTTYSTDVPTRTVSTTTNS
jgi:hypothetical protein